MAVRIIAPVAVELVSTAEAKEYLRIDHADDDAAIAKMISAAREWLERETGLALGVRRIVETIDCWALSGIVRLALGPLRMLHEVRASNSGVTTTYPAEDFAIAAWDLRPRIYASRTTPTTDAPIAGIEVEYDAGFSADDAPRPALTAILMLASAVYEGRTGQPGLPQSVKELVAPFAVRRL